MARRTPWRLIPDGSDRPVLRALLLLLVFALTVAAFWRHFGIRMQELRGRALQDAAQTLPQAEGEALAALQAMFKTGLGMSAIIRIEKEHLRVPVLEASTLFVGAGLDHHEAVVILPPLARRVMGEGARLDAEETLARCLRAQERSPGQCLHQCLETLWTRLHGQ